WQKGAVAIPGATGPSFSVANVTGANAGEYRVFVTGTCGSRSAVATLTVSEPLLVSVDPVATCPGMPVTLVAKHNAGPGATYRWNPGGATAPSLTVGPMVTTSYSVQVTSADGCTGEAVAMVAVGDTLPPVITQCAAARTLNAANCQAVVPDLTKEVV